MTNTDPQISEYFRQLAQRRRNPYRPFKDDPEAASRAGKLGAEARWHAKKEFQEENQANEPAPQDAAPTR